MAEDHVAGQVGSVEDDPFGRLLQQATMHFGLSALWLNAALHRNTAENPREIAVIDAFAGAQLDLALNRPNVVHAALLAGPASETFLARCRRLERFRTGDQQHQAGKAAPR